MCVCECVLGGRLLCLCVGVRLLCVRGEVGTCGFVLECVCVCVCEERGCCVCVCVCIHVCVYV